METSDFQKFRETILKVKDNRNHKIKGSIGVYAAYKWLRKNKWLNIPRPLTEHEFYSIIRRINSYLAEELLKGNDINLPCRMGKIEVRKVNKKIVFKNGKLVSLPIDWDTTLKLWYEDKEAYDDRQLVYDESKQSYRILYNVSTANYNNKIFYQFTLNREIKLKIREKLKEGALDAFILR